MTTTERLAAYAHDAWAGWWRYMHGRSQPTADGSIEIPEEYVLRWWRQADTPYADLPEAEKESDREQAARILAIVGERIADLEAENAQLRRDMVFSDDFRESYYTLEQRVLELNAENAALRAQLVQP